NYINDKLDVDSPSEDEKEMQNDVVVQDMKRTASEEYVLQAFDSSKIDFFLQRVGRITGMPIQNQLPTKSNPKNERGKVQTTTAPSVILPNRWFTSPANLFSSTMTSIAPMRNMRATHAKSSAKNSDFLDW
ncbi:unnamed protein product, partial [Didymodactylos carnosus]